MIKPKKYDLLDYALTEEQIQAGNKIVAYRAEIEWVDGFPYLKNAPTVLSSAPETTLLDLMKKVLDLPYCGKDPRLQNLSVGEAMVVSMGLRAADGDEKARTEIFDRLLGKPQQNIKSVSLSGNLNEFLDKVAAETRIQTVDVPVESAETVDANMDVEDL